MLRVCLSLASIVQYLERRLLSSVTSVSGLPLRTIKFCSVLVGVVVHAGCDKHDSLMRGDLRANVVTARSTAEIVDRTPPVFDPKARYWSKIAIFLPTPCAVDASVEGRSHWNIAITFGTEKTTVLWLPDSEKF